MLRKDNAETEQRSSMPLPATQNYSSSNSMSDHTYDSDDSLEDPNFDVLDEIRSSVSRLSVKKKPKLRIAKDKDEDTEEDPYVVEMVVPKLDKKDEETYDIIQKIVEDGEVQGLKVDQCKIYLRKHGLRLTGTKDILIQRIKEHLNILSVGGEKKYPPSTFVVNCQGDACTGDIVLFEQNVYEMFNIASRCANGPPCGTRVIAGRIVKESYGTAKQQHTFTIEVLWSKGEKPLPPLHPLLIKGRNLYRLKTMRQRWEDEGERQRILTEKHDRGCVARSKREARIQQREMRKMLRSNRVLESKGVHKSEENRNSLSISSMNITNQPQQQAENLQDTSQPQCFKEMTTSSMKANMPFDRLCIQRQPLASMDDNLSMVSVGIAPGRKFMSKHSTTSGHLSSSKEGPNINGLIPLPVRYAYQQNIGNETVKSSFQRHKGSFVQKHSYPGNPNFNPLRSARETRPENGKLCRYYAQGRCYYGQNCKYLHQC